MYTLKNTHRCSGQCLKKMAMGLLKKRPQRRGGSETISITTHRDRARCRISCRSRKGQETKHTLHSAHDLHPPTGDTNPPNHSESMSYDIQICNAVA